MSARLIPSRKTVLGLMAAGLLGSTLLTASTMLPPPAPAMAQTQQLIDPTRSFAPLVERVMPSVVSVKVKIEEASSNGPDMSQVPEQFRDFFNQFPQFRDQLPNGPGRPHPRQGMAQGSGFVISADGYVVTNNHVVDSAKALQVTFQDGSEYDATVVGTDPKTDLALLKIKSDKSFPAVPLASAEAKVGDWVMAVGNPFGLGGTVTAGIVSARGRDIGNGPYDDFIQIDASINKGNSGGPSFNLNGEVVGVNSAIFSPSGGSVGIGFAIPASIVKDVVGNLRSDGAVTRGWLGVQIQPVTEDLAESLGLDKARGAIIADLTEKSPALDAGLKQGDTILKANGEDIDDARDLARTIAKVKPGSDIAVDIFRNGKPMTVTVKIGTMPGEAPKMAGVSKADEGFDLSALGLEVAPTDDGAGVRITAVNPDSAAAERGLKAGDIVLEVAGHQVTSPADMRDALQKEDGKRVLLLIRSGDGQRYIALPRERS
jgi:serine protease Do